MAPCPIRRLDLKSEVKTSVAEDMEKLKKKKTSYTAGGKVQWHNRLCKTTW